MRKLVKLGLAGLVALSANAANAEVWRWSFGGEQGTITATADGAPGTYRMTDFEVTSSKAGALIGSKSSGAYRTNNFGTDEAYTFLWNGSKVESWHHQGINTFDWWVFQEMRGSGSRFFFIGWDAGNVNDPGSAAFFDANAWQVADLGRMEMMLQSVPEPTSIALCLSALGLMAGSRRRKA